MNEQDVVELHETHALSSPEGIESDNNTSQSDEVKMDADTKGKAHGQTGPKSIAGKNRARWNALKDGSTAKSMVLPFEDEQLYQKHIREVEKALAPANYVEAQMVREYAEGLWRIIRHEKRGAYERELILKAITPLMVANMLGIEASYAQVAPDFLVDLKHRVSKKEQDSAKVCLSQYQHLQKNAKGIANFHMVFQQYEFLFRALGQWALIQDPSMTPIIGGTNVGLSLAWQQNPKQFLELLDTFAKQMYFVAFFEEWKPAIRVWMESWFFLQKIDMRRLENLDQLLVKERNHTYGMLEKLTRFRKSNAYLTTVPAHLSLMQMPKAA